MVPPTIYFSKQTEALRHQESPLAIQLCPTGTVEQFSIDLSIWLPGRPIQMHVQGIGSEIWRLYASKGFLLVPLCLGRGLPSNYLILRSEFFPLQPKSRLWPRNYTRPTPCSPLKKELGQLTGTAGSPLQNLETPAYAMVTQTNLGAKWPHLHEETQTVGPCGFPSLKRTLPRIFAVHKPGQDPPTSLTMWVPWRPNFYKGRHPTPQGLRSAGIWVI